MASLFQTPLAAPDRHIGTLVENTNGRMTIDLRDLCTQLASRSVLCLAVLTGGFGVLGCTGDPSRISAANG